METYEPGEALRRTMFEFRIAGRELSQATGISERQISEFKNGKRDMVATNLVKLSKALPDAARNYFVSLTFGLPGGANF